jgi:CRISPR/Cas system-associated protein Cas10 (large subunit of type III CRISPR-Cas system)
MYQQRFDRNFNCFKLIDELDECYKDNVGSFAEENKFNVPTLSYGITITYIKHPLKQAMQRLMI